MTDSEIRELRVLAAQLSVNILRMIQIAGSGRTRGPVSAMEIVGYLYFRHMGLTLPGSLARVATAVAAFP
jgi:transketolase N-terminal domain/subunit